MKFAFPVAPLLVSLLAVFSHPLQAEDWPQFRGPNCSGISTSSQALPVKFSATEKVAWTTKLGDGIGCPVVAAGRVFVSAIVDKEKIGLKVERTYKDGKLEGLVTEWYENGQKSGESTYKDGKQHGLETLWHTNGQKKLEVTYLNGTETSVTEWDESGNQTSR